MRASRLRMYKRPYAGKNMVGIVLALLVLLQTVQLGGIAPHTSAAPVAVPDGVIKQVLLLQGQSFGQGELEACFEATKNEPDSLPAAPPANCADLLAAVKYGNVEPSYLGTFEAALGAVNYPFTIAYEWEIPDEVAENGGTYVFNLPDALKLEADISDGTLGEAGWFAIDKDTKQITITFADQSAKEPLQRQKSGGMQVNAWLEETTVIENNEIRITIPVSATGSVTFDLPVDTGNPAPSIEKRLAGVDRPVNTSRVDWVVDVNRSLADIGHLIVRDVLPQELELDVASVTVHPLQINMAGQAVEQPALTSGYDVDTSVAEQFSIDLGGPTSSAYRIKFSTNVKSDANITETPRPLTNNVYLHDGPGLEHKAHASANVSVQRGPLMRKEAGSYQPDNDHTVTWRLYYNFGELTHNDPELTDTLPMGHRLVNGTLTVEKVNVEADGSAGTVIETLTEGATDGQYGFVSTTSPAANHQDRFAITLHGEIGSAYLITYVTQAKPSAPVVITESKSNTFESSTDSGSRSASVEYLQRIIDKSGRITDYRNKQMTWTIVLNKNEYRFEEEGAAKVKLVDTFNSRGLTLNDGELVITPKGGTPLTAADYTLTTTWDGPRQSGFEIVFADHYIFDKEHTITYNTTFDYDWFPETAPGEPQWSPSNYTFRNTGVFSWGKITDATGSETLYGSGSQTDSDTIRPNSHTQHNGYKSGSYDARDKTITWNVMFNYHNESIMSGATLTDTLLSGQELVTGSVVVKSQSITADSNGTLSDVATLVEDTDYEVEYNTDGQDHVLTIRFLVPITGPHLVTFKTELQGELVPQVISNTAEFRSSNDNYRATLTASVSPNFGGEFIIKRFTQDPAALRLAKWTMWINRSLSKLDEIVVEDTPDQYQTIVPDSFKLYKAEPNVANPTGDGHFARTELVRDQDYSIDPLDGVPNGFKLTISVPQEVAYVLEYESLLAQSVGSSTTNQYKMSGWGSTIISEPAQHTFNVNKSSASGFSFPSSAAYRGKVKLIKHADDDPAVKLPGATFRIKPKFGDDTIPVEVTDNNGEVLFENLPFDVYEIVEVIAPGGYKLDTTAHEIIVNSSDEQVVELSNVYNSGRIGDYVWLDRNRNGRQNLDETGINGITVNLYKAGEPAVYRTTETANSGTGNPGYYMFNGLEPGDYIVQFEWPIDYELTDHIPGDRHLDSNELDDDNKTSVITLNRGNNFEDLTIDIGLVAKGKIGNYVWLDWNRNGIQDEEDEHGINGIEVILFKDTADGRVEVTRTFTADHPDDGKPGYYLFDHLLHGDYYVQFLVPDSYNKTDEGVGTNPRIDSNVTDGTGLTDKIEIGPGQWEDLTIDLGLQAKGKIGDFVWFDKNDNGRQDADEPGIANHIVELYKETPTGEELVERIRTDANGKYLFDHLVQGVYYVKFETPSIYDFAKTNVGVPADEDSNAIHTDGPNKGRTVAPIIIGPGQWEDLTIDLGFTGKGAIGNYVWHDRNRNGIQDEDPMHGINGVTVNLYRDTPGGTPYKTDVTKTENGFPGYYSFTELPQGTYYVQFIFPDEYEKTVAETDEHAADGSNWTNESNITNPIVIGETETPYGWVNPSIDLGLVAQGSIGDYVWLDRNRNGIQDENESGENGITLRLYKNSTDGPVYHETVTSNGPDGKPGYYLFDNLASGNYYVQILLDSNHEVTLAEQGSGDNADELDSNAVNEHNMTTAIPIGNTAPKGWHDPTIDFGIVRLGAIGDYVWYDLNYNGKQDEEPRYGLNGVRVKLFDADKNLLETTVTADKDGKPGYYLFDHLVAGNYYIQFETPAGYILTKAGAEGVLRSQDSNPIIDGYTEVIAIGPDAPATWRNMTIDQGYYYIPYIPTPTPTPTDEPEETEEPGESPTPTPTPTPSPGTTPVPSESPAPTPVPTPSPGETVNPTPTPITEKTPEETEIIGEIEVPRGGTTDIGTPPSNGHVTITPDGKWSYTPKPGFIGKDRFSIVVKDENGEEEEIWFEIDVEEIPQGGVDALPDVDKLPKTGQESYLLMYLIGIALIAGGLLLSLKRKKSAV